VISLSRVSEEQTQRLLQRIIETDGIKKIQDVIHAVLDSGTVEAQGRDPSNVLRSLAVDSSGKLRVVTT